jgi:hypothetical protein
MRLKSSLVALVLLLAGLTPVSFADENPDWPPRNDTGEKRLGMHIQDDFGVGMSNRLSKSLIPGPQPDCSSLDDPKCTSLTNVPWWVIRILPLCEDTDKDDDCVESLQITKDGVTRDSVVKERIRARTWTADSNRGLPVAGSQGLWSDPFSDDSDRRYFVNVYGDLGSQNGDKGPFVLNNFFASITPTSESTQVTGTCVWNQGSRCGRRTDFIGSPNISLTLHLSPTLTGWLGGRLSSPQISVTPITKKLNRIVISGEPLSVNVVGASIPYQSAPEDLRTYMRGVNPGCPVDACDVGIASSGPHTFEYLEKWKPVTQDRAARTIPYWSISRAPASINSNCIKDGFVGLVTTNATAYQQEMPALDGSDLVYKVAGAHYMPDGKTLTQGTYNLLLRSDVARCVYGFSGAPIKASVSIVNNGDVQSVATEVVSERNGWLFLAAAGFNFSSPTLRVKLSQEVAAKPSPIAPKTSTKTQSITCQKAKVKKVVKGAKPVCPKGFKKVA